MARRGARTVGKKRGLSPAANEAPPPVMVDYIDPATAEVTAMPADEALARQAADLEASRASSPKLGDEALGGGGDFEAPVLAPRLAEFRETQFDLVGSDTALERISEINEALGNAEVGYPQDVPWLLERYAREWEWNAVRQNYHLNLQEATYGGNIEEYSEVAQRFARRERILGGFSLIVDEIERLKDTTGVNEFDEQDVLQTLVKDVHFLCTAATVDEIDAELDDFVRRYQSGVGANREIELLDLTTQYWKIIGTVTNDPNMLYGEVAALSHNAFIEETTGLALTERSKLNPEEVAEINRRLAIVGGDDLEAKKDLANKLIAEYRQQVSLAAGQSIEGALRDWRSNKAVAEERDSNLIGQEEFEDGDQIDARILLANMEVKILNQIEDQQPPPELWEAGFAYKNLILASDLEYQLIDQGQVPTSDDLINLCYAMNERDFDQDAVETLRAMGMSNPPSPGLGESLRPNAVDRGRVLNLLRTMSSELWTTYSENYHAQVVHYAARELVKQYPDREGEFQQLVPEAFSEAVPDTEVTVPEVVTDVVADAVSDEDIPPVSNNPSELTPVQRQFLESLARDQKRAFGDVLAEFRAGQALLAADAERLVAGDQALDADVTAPPGSDSTATSAVQTSPAVVSGQTASEAQRLAVPMINRSKERLGSRNFPREQVSSPEVMAQVTALLAADFLAHQENLRQVEITENGLVWMNERFNPDAYNENTVYRAYLEIPIELIPQVLPKVKEVADSFAVGAKGIEVRWLAGRIPEDDRRGNKMVQVNKSAGNFENIHPDTPRIIVSCNSYKDVLDYLRGLIAEAEWTPIEEQARAWKRDVLNAPDRRLGNQWVKNPNATEPGATYRSVSITSRPAVRLESEGEKLKEFKYVAPRTPELVPPHLPVAQVEVAPLVALTPQEVLRQIDSGFRGNKEAAERYFDLKFTARGWQRWDQLRFGEWPVGVGEEKLFHTYLSPDPAEIPYVIAALNRILNQFNYGSGEGVLLRYVSGAGSDPSEIKTHSGISGTYRGLTPTGPRIILLAPNASLNQQIIDLLRGETSLEAVMANTTIEAMAKVGKVKSRGEGFNFRAVPNYSQAEWTALQNAYQGSGTQRQGRQRSRN